MTAWEVIDVPEMLNVEMQIELRSRNRAERNRTAEQEREPDPATVSFWRRVYLKLEKHDMWLIWQEAFKIIQQKSLQPETCRHDDPTRLRATGNKYCRQVFCQMCKKTVVYEHTKDGVISWMNTFGDLVRKKVLPPHPDMLHPEEPAASRYCRRCAHPMVRVNNSMYQCSQHSAANMCTFARNGHYPPGDRQKKAQKDTEDNRKMKLWTEYDTVITATKDKISGATINTIGRTFKGVSYKEIFETTDHKGEKPYVEWALATAPSDSGASPELKHMASFLLAAQEVTLLIAAQPSSSQPASSSATMGPGSTTQPTGAANAKRKAKAKPKTSPVTVNMAESDEEEFW